MTSTIKASFLRLKYLTSSAYNTSLESNRTAAVVGATSGIGKACANRLAEQGYNVIAVGRDRPGRAESVIQELNKFSSSSASTLGITTPPSPKHEFYACDAFSLSNVQKTAEEIKSNHPTIDVLILTQGMATTQGFTPTEEGNDEKMTLHYYSRMAMTLGLLSALRKSTKPQGAVVMTVLSGGVHGVYEKMEEDIDLKKNYSVKNAADAAGYYTDLGFDSLACKEENEGIQFVHAAPGFIKTNWGTEFNVVLRSMVRCMQAVLAREPSECADYLLSPSVFASDVENEEGGLPVRLNGRKEGIHIIGEKGQVEGLTKNHTESAKEILWKHSCSILEKAGVKVE